MRFIILVLFCCGVSCKVMDVNPEQSSEIVKQSSNKEKIETLERVGSQEGVVPIKVKNKVYLQGYNAALSGCVTDQKGSYLHVYHMSHVEIEGRPRLKVNFSKNGEFILLPIITRFKSGKVKVEAIITINDKPLKAKFYVRVGQKSWDVSLGNKLIEHNYKVIGRD